MRYIVTSDIHLGHKNTSTKHIIESFKRVILTQANTCIDALFIAGDFFDHLLYLNTQEAQQIVQFFHHLLSYCHDNNISLKVLEGTPCHDWYQSSMLVKINDVRTKKADLTYVKTLDIIHCPKLNKHILYIPDEWCNTQEELDLQIRTHLKELGLSKVDIAILHGAFKYQAKGVPASAFLYDEDYFLQLCRGYIHIGHYHTHSTLDRIVAQGSLERLAHGEEETKGYVLVQDQAYSFIENTRSYTYKTIQVTNSTDLSKLDKVIHKYPHGSHIRLQLKPEHPFNTIFKELTVRYADYKLKKLIKDPASANSSVTYIVSEQDLSSPEHLVLETNAHEAVLRGIEAKHQLTPTELVKLHHYAKILEKTEPREETT